MILESKIENIYFQQSSSPNPNNALKSPKVDHKARSSPKHVSPIVSLQTPDSSLASPPSSSNSSSRQSTEDKDMGGTTEEVLESSLTEALAKVSDANQGMNRE